MIQGAIPARILLISQWPNVKNGEYELIEKIKQTGYKVTVVDYLGFDVDTGICLNHANTIDNYDFAISFHYDTPKFINIPTFLWVANPLEFMHLRGDYRDVLINHLRSYDEYLYNGSYTLKSHIKSVVGSSWIDSELEMYPACSREAIFPPSLGVEKPVETGKKIFYCGVNWERGIDQAGRAQGLLDILQEKQIADFYGPDKLEGNSPWEGFSSYKGEIPFDGISMSSIMQNYGAVLAVSSPAHLKSRTSSSRVFEGIAAGVPVITDENPHVSNLFGDLVYYFKGANEQERAESILSALNRIIEKPLEAQDKVAKAQKLMFSRYSFEPCFDRALQYVVGNVEKKNSSASSAAKSNSIDIFLFHHDPNSLQNEDGITFQNLDHVIAAAAYAVKKQTAKVRILLCTSEVSPDDFPSDLILGIQVTPIKVEELTSLNWDSLRLGEKLSLMSKKSGAELISFFNQFDFPHYDYFTKAIDSFAKNGLESNVGISVSGFFVNNLAEKAPFSAAGILRNNKSSAMYRWTQNSLAEHQLATIVFSRKALELLENAEIGRYDATLPVALVALITANGMDVCRLRHILLRVQYGHFHRHYEKYTHAVSKGFWAQHYDLVTNYNHELNALYDLLHESPLGVEIVDKISGYDLPKPLPVDPALREVSLLMNRYRPLLHWLGKVKRIITFKVKS